MTIKHLNTKEKLKEFCENVVFNETSMSDEEVQQELIKLQKIHNDLVSLNNKLKTGKAYTQ
jgi:hypothetical protein